MRRLLVPLLGLAMLPSLLGTSWAAPTAAAPTKPAISNRASLKKERLSKGEKLGSTVININTASEAELRRVPGIGKSRAAKIVKARPFSSLDELVQKKIMTARELQKARPHLSVR